MKDNKKNNKFDGDEKKKYDSWYREKYETVVDICLDSLPNFKSYCEWSIVWSTRGWISPRRASTSSSFPSRLHSSIPAVIFQRKAPPIASLSSKVPQLIFRGTKVRRKQDSHLSWICTFERPQCSSHHFLPSQLLPSISPQSKKNWVWA